MTDRVTKAEELRTRFRSTEARVREDTSLTDRAKADRVAAARATLNEELRRLAAEDAQSLTSERADLERRLFGPPALPLGSTPSDRIARDASFRDGMERARRTQTRGELLQLWSDATRTGDNLQQRAAMAVALERQDLDVLNAHIAEPANAHLERDLQRLFDIRTQTESTRGIVAQAMAFAEEHT